MQFLPGGLEEWWSSFVGVRIHASICWYNGYECFAGGNGLNVTRANATLILLHMFKI